MIRYVLAAPIVVVVAALVIGALAGRVRLRNCCAAADASSDRRMGTPGAFEP